MAKSRGNLVKASCRSLGRPGGMSGRDVREGLDPARSFYIRTKDDAGITGFDTFANDVGAHDGGARQNLHPLGEVCPLTSTVEIAMRRHGDSDRGQVPKKID